MEYKEYVHKSESIMLATLTVRHLDLATFLMHTCEASLLNIARISFIHAIMCQWELINIRSWRRIFIKLGII